MNDKHIFILTRYSVLVNKSNAWKLSRGMGLEGYKRKLFDTSRLKEHEFFLKNVVIPSIENQNNFNLNSNFTHGIVTSTLLPFEFKEALYNLANQREWLKIVEMAPEGDLNNSFASLIGTALSEQPTTYVTIRLDDDDALGPDFLKGISEYLLREYDNAVITHPKGYAISYDVRTKKSKKAISIYYPKSAQGLAYVRHISNLSELASDSSMSIFPRHIYETGDHTKVDKRYHLICDETRDGYIRMCYESQDTQEHSFKKRDKGDNEVSIDSLVSKFNIRLD